MSALPEKACPAPETPDRLKAQLQEQAHYMAFLEAVFEATADGLLVSDPSGKIIGYNDRFLRLWPIEEPMIKAGLPALLAALGDMTSDTDPLERLASQAASAPKEIAMERLQLIDGRVMHLVTLPLRIHDELRGRVWNCRDVTEHLLAPPAAAPKAATPRADETTDHLNNILTAILGHAQIAAEQTSDPLAGQALQDIIQASRRASGILRHGRTTTSEAVIALEAEALAPLRKDLATSGITKGGGERILVVDDEPAVCQFIEAVLVKVGYKVAAFTDSVKAADLFRNERQTFSLVITDLNMPQLNGAELAHRIRKCRADIPIILASGYEHGLSRDLLAEAGIVSEIIKPISPEALADAAHDALRKKPAPRASDDDPIVLDAVLVG